MSDRETLLINKSIQSYKNMIKYFRTQILILEKNKMKLNERCPECIRLPIKKIEESTNKIIQQHEEAFIKLSEEIDE